MMCVVIHSEILLNELCGDCLIYSTSELTSITIDSIAG